MKKRHSLQDVLDSIGEDGEITPAELNLLQKLAKNESAQQVAVGAGMGAFIIFIIPVLLFVFVVAMGFVGNGQDGVNIVLQAFLAS